MARVLTETDRWSKRRERTEELKERWPFALEVLTFYGRLLDVQERAYAAAREDAPPSEALVAYVAERVTKRVIEVSVADGPPALVGAVLERFHESDVSEFIAGWLRGDELDGVARYLAHSAAGPV